jgi:hypothetical protein
VVLHQCLTFLRERDELIVCTPDRLCQTVGQMLKLVADLAKRGIRLIVRSFGGPPLDTGVAASRDALTLLAGVGALGTCGPSGEPACGHPTGPERG